MAQLVRFRPYTDRADSRQGSGRGRCGPVSSRRKEQEEKMKLGEFLERRSRQRSTVVDEAYVDTERLDMSEND